MFDKMRATEKRSLRQRALAHRDAKAQIGLLAGKRIARSFSIASHSLPGHIGFKVVTAEGKSLQFSLTAADAERFAEDLDYAHMESAKALENAAK